MITRAADETEPAGGDEALLNDHTGHEQSDE